MVMTGREVRSRKRFEALHLGVANRRREFTL
jgi:hypothetical protein